MRKRYVIKMNVTKNDKVEEPIPLWLSIHEIVNIGGGKPSMKFWADQDKYDIMEFDTIEAAEEYLLCVVADAKYLGNAYVSEILVV